MKIKQILNLKDWHERRLNVGFGTRDKTVLKQSSRGKVYYLAKTYDKNIGELRSEVCASAIGRLIGIPVQKTWLCTIPQHKTLGLRYSHGVLIQLDVRRQRDTRRNQFREDLIHGSALISRVNGRFAALKNEKYRRKIYTLDSVVKALREYIKRKPSAKSLWDEFFELLVFDALIGGTDRHYNNWGILERADSGQYIRLAPAFDNGVSLLWKIDEYRAKFLKDLLIRDFPRRAESMFKKRGGGKYTLYEVLGKLHTIGDYRGSDIVSKMLEKLEAISPSDIHRAVFRSVPQKKSFQTNGENLELISMYVNVRLELLIGTLKQIKAK